MILFTTPDRVRGRLRNEGPRREIAGAFGRSCLLRASRNARNAFLRFRPNPSSPVYSTGRFRLLMNTGENYKNFVFLRAFVVKIIFIRDSAGIIGRQTCRDTRPPEEEAEREKDRTNISDQECTMNTAGHEKIGDCP